MANRKYEIIDDYFDFINNEQKAYLLGFFIADGCISKPNACKFPKSKYLRLAVGLSKEDENVVELFRDSICPDIPIKNSFHTKGAKNRKPVSKISWGSTYMGNVLINKYKIVVNKTKDSNFVFDFSLVPDDLLCHFIRGFFDGDGQISCSQNGRVITFGIYSTSKYFLKQIGDIFHEKFDLEYKIEGTKKKNVELFLLRFNKNHIKKRNKRKEYIADIYNWFYSKSTCFLFRKKIKFEHYLNTEVSK